MSASERAPWWRSGVIYQVYPRSFADADGDGVGDLEGVRQHLDHLAWLGVDAVWLSPFYRSPMADFGYDVADYCDVDPQPGQVVEALAGPLEVADAVTVGIGERPRIHLVDDSGSPPGEGLWARHRRSLGFSPGCAISRVPR